MSPTQQAFLELLAAFAAKRAPRLAVLPDWPAIARLAKNHSVEGIIAVMAGKLPADQRPPAPLYERLHRAMQVQAARSIRQEMAMRKLMDEMEREHIDHLLLKGIVVRDYYPIPELRTFSDIDFLIRPEDEQRMDALMERLGYTISKYLDYVSVCRKDNLEHYEIHTNILFNMAVQCEKYRDYVSDSWSHAQLTFGSHGYVFTPEYHLLYVLLHVAKHFCTAGAGFRMFLDIAILLRHGPAIDWDQVRRMASETESESFVAHALDLCRLWFGAVAPSAFPAPVSDGYYDKAFEHVMHGGTFGTHNTAKIKPLRAALENRPDHIGAAQAKAILRFLLPPYSYMIKKYSWLRGKPWLLPFTWPMRAISNLCQPQGRRELANIKRYLLHGRTAKDQNRLFQEMGLSSLPLEVIDPDNN